MTPEISRALEASITHWKRIVADPLGESSKSKDCALCQLELGCQNCPVQLRTGRSGCLETPYHPFQKAKEATLEAYDGTPISTGRLSYLSALAEEELEFLISLREETSTMVHSCVEFNLVLHIADPLSKQLILLKAIGLDPIECRHIVGQARAARHNAEGYRVRVTLAQFAIFLLKRHELRMTTDFWILEAKRTSQSDEVVDLTHYKEGKA